MSSARRQRRRRARLWAERHPMFGPEATAWDRSRAALIDVSAAFRAALGATPWPVSGFAPPDSPYYVTDSDA